MQCDGSYPTFLLEHWARDRTRGDGLPLEFLVNKQARATAVAFGFHDRGLLRPGYKVLAYCLEGHRTKHASKDSQLHLYK